MENLLARKAVPADSSQLVEIRLKQLEEEGAVATGDIRRYLKDFYELQLDLENFVSWVVCDDDKIIASSGITFFYKPPYFLNPTGCIGEVSNMYTEPAYRRKGIGRQLLSLLCKEAGRRGCPMIQVTASEAGKPMYMEFGFRGNDQYLKLDI
ncbi:MAG: GNAT family N-acetyltransferase [Lachnospiraceae bacterium]